MEEVFEDSDEENAERHCIKLINGELFMFCNIHSRDQFLSINMSAFEAASSCEVGAKSTARETESDVRHLIDGLFLPMNED